MTRLRPSAEVSGGGTRPTRGGGTPARPRAATNTRGSVRPGQRSSDAKSPNYCRSGQPYFDKVTIIDFTDPAAQVNALLGGQLDAITDNTFGQVTVVKAHSHM